MNKQEYIIINKTQILEKINELEEEINNLEKISYNPSSLYLFLKYEKNLYKLLLSQSTPLNPEIEKAYDAGKLDKELSLSFDNPKGRYVSSLKLDI